MIESLHSAIATDAKAIFKSRKEQLSKEGFSVAVSHFGVFSQDLINSLSSGVEDLLISSGDKKHIVKRMFSILIEGLQNVRIHGEKDQYDKQIGFLQIAKCDQFYKVIFGNILSANDKEALTHYLNNINEMSEAELKEMYLDVLSMGYLSQKGGAGLGFITMKLKSANKMKFDIESISDNKFFFCIEVKLER